MNVNVTMPKEWAEFGINDGKRKIRLGTEESKFLIGRLLMGDDAMDGTLANDTAGCVTVISLGLGISIVDVSLEPLQIFNDKMPVPIESYGIMQGRYVGVGNDESSPYDLSILATSKEQLAALDGSRYVATPAGVHVTDGEGEDRPLTADVVRELVDAGELSEDALGIDFRKLWSMHHEEDTGRFTTNMYQIVAGVAFLRQLASMSMPGAEEHDGLSPAKAEARIAAQLEEKEAERFKSSYLEGILAHDGRYWRFPYTEVSRALLERQWPNAYVPMGQVVELIGERRYESLMKASFNVERHFRQVLEVVEREGSLRNDQGESALKHGENGVCITPIVVALASDGYTMDEIFGDYEPWFSVDSLEDGEDDQLCEWYLKSVDRKSHELVWGKDGEELTTMPYGLTEETKPFMYLALYALVSLLGCKNSVYQIIYPMKRDRKKSQIRTQQRILPNDSATRGLFGRDKDFITADKYHPEEGEEKAIVTIPTGKNTSIDLTIIHNQSFESLVETYQLSPIDGFWYETIVSINYNDGKEPITKMRGSDLLRFNDYANPYQESAQDTMKSAYDCVRKMAYTLRVAIDATNERRRYENVAEAYREQPIIDANVSVMRFDDGTEDFEIELNTTGGKEAFTALPLAQYASDKEQIVSMQRADMQFKTVKPLRIEHRMMWRYVWRRVHEKKTSNTIVFDTIFRNIGLEDINRFKRARMLTVLHKMLEERRSQGVLTFTWNKKGQREHSVEIHVKKKNNENALIEN